MRVLLVPNTGNAQAVLAATELTAWLSGAGYVPLLSQGDAAESGLAGFGVSTSDLGDLALVIALGGDGTILKAVHLIGGSEVPVLGVNYGRLGFLSGAGPEYMREAVTAALAGEAAIERRATLRASVVMEGRDVGEYLGLNEVVVSRWPSGRVAEFDLSIDGHRMMRIRADGVIVATATGSTAYSLSAGGPLAAPGFGGMIVSPVAPHTLRSRSLITDPTDTIEIELSDPTRADACVAVDGDVTPCRRAIERVTVCRGEHDVLLVKHDGRDFYETLSTEFFGA